MGSLPLRTSPRKYTDISSRHDLPHSIAFSFQLAFVNTDIDVGCHNLSEGEVNPILAFSATTQ